MVRLKTFHWIDTNRPPRFGSWSLICNFLILLFLFNCLIWLDLELLLLSGGSCSFLWKFAQGWWYFSHAVGLNAVTSFIWDFNRVLEVSNTASIAAAFHVFSQNLSSAKQRFCAFIAEKDPLRRSLPKALFTQDVVWSTIFVSCKKRVVLEWRVGKLDKNKQNLHLLTSIPRTL